MAGVTNTSAVCVRSVQHETKQNSVFSRKTTVQDIVTFRPSATTAVARVSIQGALFQVKFK